MLYVRTLLFSPGFLPPTETPYIEVHSQPDHQRPGRSVKSRWGNTGLHSISQCLTFLWGCSGCCTSQASVDAAMRRARLHLARADRAQTWQGWRYTSRSGSQRMSRQLTQAPSGLCDAPPQQLRLGGALRGRGRPALPAARARLGLHLLDVGVQGGQLPVQLPELSRLLRPALHALPTSQTCRCDRRYHSIYAGVLRASVRGWPGICHRCMHNESAVSGINQCLDLQQ